MLKRIMTDIIAAKKSSAIMPTPNLIFSDFFMILNFVMSKNLNNKNPTKCINGFNPENEETNHFSPESHRPYHNYYCKSARC